MRFSTGLTLIEVLVVLTISAILMGVAAPNLRDWFSKRAVASAVGALTADFRFARSEAIKRSDFVTICRSADGSTCAKDSDSWHTGWLVFVDRQLKGNDATDGIVLRVQGALPWVKAITPSNFSGVTFSSNGTASGAAGNLVVEATAPKDSEILCLAMNGRLQARAGQSAC
jgi:type IV fimbrial biogenesis protein FimT